MFLFLHSKIGNGLFQQLQVSVSVAMSLQYDFVKT